MEAQRLSNSAAQILTTGNSAYTARARIAAEAAAQHAAAVDSAARFPAEAFAEIRKQQLLGIMVPESLGGEGATLAELADVCFILGQACSSTALIFAMHQIKMACIIRHAKGSPRWSGFFARSPAISC
jgi:acyl-CoA dehydrogenase